MFFHLFNRQKALAFLSALLANETPIEVQKNAFLFPCNKVGFVFGLYSKKIFKQNKDYFWVTPSPWFFKTKRSSVQPLYLLKKEKNSYMLYDQRWLKIEKKLYLLPPVIVNLSFLTKTPFLSQKERELFFPVRSIPFYSIGDTTCRLNNTSYLKQLENKQKKRTPYKPILQTLFLLLKKILDK